MYMVHTMIKVRGYIIKDLLNLPVCASCQKIVSASELLNHSVDESKQNKENKTEIVVDITISQYLSETIGHVQ